MSLIWGKFGINPGFRYIVNIDGVPLGAFTECTLPTLEWDVEEVKEGGMNSMVHQLPGQRKKSTVTLKNGVGIARQLLLFYQLMLAESFTRLFVTITLLNSMYIPVLVIGIKDAYPIKWEGPQLKADENTTAIQTLEFACGEIMVD